MRAGKPQARKIENKQSCVEGRYAAFSRAGAELLIETDRLGRITYASGNSEVLLECGLDSLLDMRVQELFQTDEHGLIDGILRWLGAEQRFGPLVMSLARLDGSRPTAILRGYRLAESEGALHLALNPVPSYALFAPALASPALLDLVGFAGAARDALRTARATNRDIRLTLVAVDESATPEGGQVAPGVWQDFEALLRLHSLGGRAAGQLAGGRYGLLHDGRQDAELLASDLRRLNPAAGRPSGLQPIEIRPIELRLVTIPLNSRALREAEALRALAHAVRNFVRQPAGFSDPLSDSHGDTEVEFLDYSLSRIVSLQDLIDEEAFAVAFQPIVSLTSRQIHHFEMLVRPASAQAPSDIVDLAEGMGMIHDIDLFMVERAIAYLERAGHTALPVAVNMSGSSLQNEEFVVELLTRVGHCPGLAGRLLFEITETAEIRRLDIVNNVLQSLRAHGFPICLDDFGAGAASFQYLHALTVDYVKIDGSYVARICERPRDEIMLRSLVSLCRDLGVRTIAEMVEEDRQAEKLLEIGVEFGQGFLFGRPAADCIDAPPLPHSLDG